MTTLTPCTDPGSRGRIAHGMLEETGQPFDLRWLDYDTTMKAPDWLALNPMGKVPTLVHDDRPARRRAESASEAAAKLR